MASAPFRARQAACIIAVDSAKTALNVGLRVDGLFMIAIARSCALVGTRYKDACRYDKECHYIDLLHILLDKQWGGDCFF